MFRAFLVRAPLTAAIYSLRFIVPGTMGIPNLFIGIIMNSPPGVPAEMESRERAAQETVNSRQAA